jgi:hypothetical protein
MYNSMDGLKLNLVCIFQVLYKFLQIFELGTNFWELNQLNIFGNHSQPLG